MYRDKRTTSLEYRGDDRTKNWRGLKHLNTHTQTHMHTAQHTQLKSCAWGHCGSKVTVPFTKNSSIIRKLETRHSRKLCQALFHTRQCKSKNQWKKRRVDIRRKSHAESSSSKERTRTQQVQPKWTGASTITANWIQRRMSSNCMSFHPFVPVGFSLGQLSGRGAMERTTELNGRSPDPYSREWIFRAACGHAGNEIWMCEWEQAKWHMCVCVCVRVWFCGGWQRCFRTLFYWDAVGNKDKTTAKTLLKIKKNEF